MSVVLPVRGDVERIADRVERVVRLLKSLIDDVSDAEIIVVDDTGSESTRERLEELARQQPLVQIVRHSRPRGIDAAGQSGLERATGDLVFIQEDDADIRESDMRRLYRISRDPAILAARAETTPKFVPAKLLTRLMAWGTADRVQLPTRREDVGASGLQMIRRPHLQRLAGPEGKRMVLHSDTIHSTSVDR